jgi:integrase
MRDLEIEHDEGQLRRGAPRTTGEYLEEWLKGLLATGMSAHGRQVYRQQARKYLIPRLGHIPLRKLTRQHVKDLFAELITEGLAPGSVVKVRTALSSALTEAEEAGYVAGNVARQAPAPRVRRKPMVTLTEDASDQLLAAIADPAWRALVLTALTTGMRRGEIVALRTSDVDLGGAVISVQQGADYGDEGLVFSDAKTDQARRTIRLHPRTVQCLATHSLWLDALRRKYGNVWEEHDYVFPATMLWRYRGRQLRPGRALLPHSITQHWASMREAGLVPAVMRFHDLRHSHATQLLRAGVNVKVVSERLGHGDVSVTLNTYAHVMPDMQQAAVTAMEWLLSKE